MNLAENYNRIQRQIEAACARRGRDPASVLLWYDVATGEQTGRLDVSTGFVANPHDYVQVSPSKGYVTRFHSNVEPGVSRFGYSDAGDVLSVAALIVRAALTPLALMPT